MAISQTHYQLLKLLRERGELPQGGRILEIGKANWYGDMDPRGIDKEIDTLISDVACAKLMRTWLGEAIKNADCFGIVDVVYQVLFGTGRAGIASIDLDPSAAGASKLDLNTHAADSYQVFNLTINHGTAEHVFNIANVFRVMHDATVAGGLMIHESPFTGWIDHGFYSLHPTLFYDLAAENGYTMTLVALEYLASRTATICESREHILEMARQDKLPYNAMLFVAMRKGPDAPFKIPMQGVYAGTVSAEVAQAWGELR